MSFALNTVYNNYLTNYTPKAVTRYDAHKKSELRSVYNSIVKQNKDAPWYLPTTSKATQQYAVDLKENARQLRNTLAQLGGLEEDSLFSKKSVYTSDEHVATASFIGSHNAGHSVPGLQLEVHSLASSQENLGLFLPDTRVALPAGTYSFDLGLGDVNYEYQFTIDEAETNREIQDRLARLINNSSIGIRADLVESDSRTSLRLTSESTGLGSGRSSVFTVSDDRTSKANGTVEYFGLDYVSREASNASFSVNGQEQTASRNHFTFDKNFEIDLHGVTQEGHPIQIGLKTDLESLTDNVAHLVGGYNEFLRAASSYLDSQSRSRQLVRELKTIALTYGNSMEPMGLTMEQDGTLRIDSNALHQSAEQSQDIPETFGYLKNFSNMLLRKSGQVSLNPMDYVEKVIVAYKNPGHNYVSPYITSAYSGMMFNSYC